MIVDLQPRFNRVSSSDQNFSAVAETDLTHALHGEAIQVGNADRAGRGCPCAIRWMRQGCTVGFRELRKCRRVSSGLCVPEGDIHSMGTLVAHRVMAKPSLGF
jgi:hypothetical protein